MRAALFQQRGLRSGRPPLGLLLLPLPAARVELPGDAPVHQSAWTGALDGVSLRMPDVGWYVGWWLSSLEVCGLCPEDHYCLCVVSPVADKVW